MRRLNRSDTKTAITGWCPVTDASSGEALRIMRHFPNRRFIFVGDSGEPRLAPTGITPVFPVWHKPTGPLALAMIASGVDARLVCVDLKKMPKSFAGRRFDAALLADLPPGVDPCGENGEFHSFVAAGPMLARPVAIKAGEVVERDGFAYADFLPA